MKKYIHPALNTTYIVHSNGKISKTKMVSNKPIISVETDCWNSPVWNTKEMQTIMEKYIEEYLKNNPTISSTLWHEEMRTIMDKWLAEYRKNNKVTSLKQIKKINK